MHNILLATCSVVVLGACSNPSFVTLTEDFDVDVADESGREDSMPFDASETETETSSQPFDTGGNDASETETISPPDTGAETVDAETPLDVGSPDTKPDAPDAKDTCVEDTRDGSCKPIGASCLYNSECCSLVCTGLGGVLTCRVAGC